MNLMKIIAVSLLVIYVEYCTSKTMKATLNIGEKSWRNQEKQVRS